MASFVASWGIIGCGWISSEFCKDLCLDRPEITDVVHSITAVASRDKSKAETFISAHCPGGTVAQKAGVRPAPVPYGSYDEVFNHTDVDIIYIGTLHPTHYVDAKAALEAGKHVLVEKPACLNATEWAELTALAKSKGRFLMEGLWTRFQPAVKILYDKLHVEKVLGDIKSVQTEFAMPFYNTMPDSHRALALEAAGGPLFDLGAYAMLPARIALYDNPLNESIKPDVHASMVKSRTGGDLTTTIILDFPKIEARAVCTCSFNYASLENTRATIIGTKGELYIHDGLSRITSFSIHQFGPGPNFWTRDWKEPEKIEKPFPGFGLHWEADAVARSIRDGLLENPIVTHAETALTLEIFDEVRRQGSYVLPEGMEKMGRVGV